MTEKKDAIKAKALETEKKETKEEINHVLVPKHEILSSEDISALLENMNVNTENLPKISVNDPAIQHLAPKVGDIIKITRKSKTAGVSYYYRLVIESGVITEDAPESEE